MKFTLTIFLVLIIISCGPSKEEIAQQEKRTQDSIENVVLQEKRTQDSINHIIELEKEKAILEERLRIETELKKAELDKLNNPLNYLTYETSIEERLFQENRLVVTIINNHPTKRIADVKFRVFAFAKTDTRLGSHDEIIYDFVMPGKKYNRMIELSKFPAGSHKYSVGFISAVFK